MENLSLILKFLIQHIPNVAFYSKDPIFADKREGNILQLAVLEDCVFLIKQEQNRARVDMDNNISNQTIIRKEQKAM